MLGTNEPDLRYAKSVEDGVLITHNDPFQNIVLSRNACEHHLKKAKYGP